MDYSGKNCTAVFWRLPTETYYTGRYFVEVLDLKESYLIHASTHTKQTLLVQIICIFLYNIEVREFLLISLLNLIGEIIVTYMIILAQNQHNCAHIEDKFP